MSSLSSRFVFPLAAWRGASFAQKRLNEGDIQVVFKEMRASGYKFVQKNLVKSYTVRSKASANQRAARTRFVNASSAVHAVLNDPELLATARTEFAKQYVYSTLRGYIFAREYAKLNS